MNKEYYSLTIGNTNYKLESNDNKYQVRINFLNTHGEFIINFNTLEEANDLLSELLKNSVDIN
jgi:hypothetical protein